MMYIHAKELAVYFWQCWMTLIALWNLSARGLYCETFLQQGKNSFKVWKHTGGAAPN